jgi:ABC-type multidrug transport system fused ATPase/permease subunit
VNFSGPSGYACTPALIFRYQLRIFQIYTGEVNAKRVREHYLKAVLRQDIAFFDNVGAGEVTTRISADTRGWKLLLCLILR